MFSTAAVCVRVAVIYCVSVVVCQAETQTQKQSAHFSGSGYEYDSGTHASVSWAFFVYCVFLELLMKSTKAALLPQLEFDTEGKKKTVVVIHGMASCGLETRNVREGKDWHMTWASENGIAKWVTDRKHSDWIESMSVRLVTDENGLNPRAMSSKDWEVRPVAGLNGIFSSNPGEFFEIPLYKRLLEHIHSLNLNARACNYDWRLWGDPTYSDEWVATHFKQTIEEAYSMHGRKVDVLTHSLGGHVIVYALNKMEELYPGWAQRYVAQTVNLGPALCGTVTMFGSFACGPAYFLEIFPDWLDHMIADASSTWPCLALEFPNACGSEVDSEGDPWRDHSDRPMVLFGGRGSHTVQRQYGHSRAHVTEFLNAVKDNDHCPGREEGPLLFENATKMQRLLRKCPPVPCHMIVSSAKKVVRQVRWRKDREGFLGDSNSVLDLGDMPEETHYEPGDGTLASHPLHNLTQFWKKNGGDVHWHDVPHSAESSHKGMLNDKIVHNMITRILRQGITGKLR